MTDHDPHQLLSGYALDALGAEDRAQFAAHLSDCAECRSELAELGPAIADLSALTETPPPEQLRSDLLATIGGVRQDDPIPAGDHRPSELDAARSRRARLARRVTAVIGAAALVAAIALGGWAAGRHQLGQQYGDEGVAISRVLSAPDAHTYRQRASSGMLMTYIVSEQSNAALAVPAQVPDPGSHRSYQLWTVTVRNGQQVFVPDRTFTGQGGPILLRGDIRSAAAVGVSLEPAGGSSSPTSDPIAVQSL